MQASVLAQGWTVKWPFASVCARCMQPPRKCFLEEVIMEEGCR